MMAAEAQNIREQVRRSGYCQISGLVANEILPLAARLGRVVPDPRTGSAIRDLRPQSRDHANPNTLSSRYGDGAFPFHTEAAYLPAPPHLIFLYCQHPGRGRRPTCLLDGTELIAVLRGTCRPGSWVVRAGRPPFLAHVVERTETGMALRYDATCMFPVGRAAQQEQSLIDDHLSSQAAIPIFWRAGDLAIIDNGRFLHGRGASPVDDWSRVITRVMVTEGGPDALGL
jgi:hypothetical protein